MALNVVEIWRDLHKTPELGFEENKTSAYLAEALEKLGYAVTRGVGKTGVMASSGAPSPARPDASRRQTPCLQER